MKILMVAAENDALPHGKVGGIGDVVRDIPLALAKIGHDVDVVLPSYGSFSKLAGAKHITSLGVMFAGKLQSVDIFKISLANSPKNIGQWVIEHPLFAVAGEGKIYCDDPADRPFANDATKFSLFSAAVAKAIVSHVFGDLDILHLHDWHSAMLPVLRAYDPQYQPLQAIKTVYTIHNLALQGIRPIDGDESSLKAWFPHLVYDESRINDPRYANCYNPMRAAINLSDKVHAVSPNYAKEILLPSNTKYGYFGGEGLEIDLNAAANSGRLHGILNGCEYPSKRTKVKKKNSLNPLLKTAETAILNWIGDKPLNQKAHLVALTRLKQLACKTDKPTPHNKPIIVTSVGRITDQKVQLLRQLMSNGETALEQLLNTLADDGIFILLGSGDPQFERFLTDVAAKKSNFLFLNGYSETLSENIYSTGDLFLMPSSFEPCGISQMLAMRAGQPCLAHRVGGLTDTVIDQKNGFTFTGDTPFQQVNNMLDCFKSTIKLKKEQEDKWAEICSNALNARFLWQDVAHNYVNYLYK